MDNIYIDESGSMCKREISRRTRFFFLCLVRVNDAKVVDRRYKRFVSKHMEELKEANRLHIEKELRRGVTKPSSMFVDDKFKELKGSIMTWELKEKFIKYMCVDHIIDVCLIKVDNRKIKESFYSNTARAFNYILKLVLKRCSDSWLNKEIYLHLDNRNVKTNTVHVLKEYVNTELCLTHENYKNIEVQYFQSENCKFVQIADVFANVHYSSQFNKNYKKLLIELTEEKYIVENFTFPKSSSAYKLTKIK